jgi:hypothetical protein
MFLDRVLLTQCLDHRHWAIISVGRRFDVVFVDGLIQ